MPLNCLDKLCKLSKRVATENTRILRVAASQHPFRTMVPTEGNTVQQLYETAKRVLSGRRTPSPAEVTELKGVLSRVKLEDLGLRPYNGSKGAKTLHSKKQETITYLHVHEEPDLSIGVFCMPANAVIPLHNHPGMTVFSRVLYGTMHVRAYDLVDDTSLSAQLATDRMITAPSDPTVLFPESGGNIHAFKAITQVAVLDVLSPPYDPKDGRDCTYYQEHLPRELIADDGRLQYSDGLQNGQGLVQLEGASMPGSSRARCTQVCEPPANFAVVRGWYEGLTVRPLTGRG